MLLNLNVKNWAMKSVASWRRHDNGIGRGRCVYMIQVIGRRSGDTSLTVDVWTELHQLDRAQCGFERDSVVSTGQSISVLSLTVIGTGLFLCDQFE